MAEIVLQIHSLFVLNDGTHSFQLGIWAPRIKTIYFLVSLAVNCVHEIKSGHWEIRGSGLCEFLKVCSKKRGETFFSFPPFCWLESRCNGWNSSSRLGV